MSFKGALLFALNAVSLTFIFFCHFIPPSAALLGACRLVPALEYEWLHHTPRNCCNSGFPRLKSKILSNNGEKRGKTSYLLPVRESNHHLGSQAQTLPKMLPLYLYR
jgi:hypothetical protein